jgi:hypothetical protein
MSSSYHLLLGSPPSRETNGHSVTQHSMTRGAVVARLPVWGQKASPLGVGANGPRRFSGFSALCKNSC